MYCTICHNEVLSQGMALRMPNTQTATLTIRLFDHELEDIKKAAKRADKSMSDFVRETLLRKARRPQKLS